MIELKNINKSFIMGDTKVDILKGIDLVIEQGDFVAIMGPSGSGKSTLMNILGLLDVPTEGSYKLNHQEVAKLSEDELAIIRRSEIGFIFQQFNLLPRLEAWQNVSLPLIYSEGEFSFDKAKDLLNQVGLGDRLHHKTNEVSGGQQQRIAIARSLINNPRIIFADEPTGNLDSKSEAEVLEILRKLNAQGITVIIVTHEEAIGREANRLIKLKDGLIVSDERKSPLPSNLTKPSKVIKDTKFSLFSILEFFKQGFRTLISNKVRSLLSMLGILIGVASVVIMLSLGTGAKNSIEKELTSMGSNVLMLMGGSVRIGGVAQETGLRVRLKPEDAKIINSQVANVVASSGRSSGRAQVTHLNKNWNTSIVGVNPEYESMRASKPKYGRFFSHEENFKKSLVAVIGPTVAKELFGEKNPIGSMIRINKISFSIIGVLPVKGSSGMQDQDDQIIVPLQTAMYRLFGKNYLDSIDIQINHRNNIDAAIKDIKAAMNKRYKIPVSSQEEAFRIFNMAEIQEAVTKSVGSISSLLSVIAAISLLVGGIGIMNIMLVSVTERTKEIGLRKAVGAKRIDILMQFLTESVEVSFLGGFMGLALAWIVIAVVAKILGWDMMISISSVILSFGFSVFVGLVFGIYPAYKASKLNPIDALRYE